MVRIPFFSKSEAAAPLRDVLKHAADESGLDERQVAILLSHLLEGVVAQVAKGRPVRLPGFGMFVAARVDHPAALAKDPSPRCLPRFSPSRAFMQEVRWSAIPDDKGKRLLASHRRSHSTNSHPTKAHSRAFTAQAAFRRSIEAQLRER